MQPHQTVCPEHYLPSFFSFMLCGSLRHSENIYWTPTLCPKLLGSGGTCITETWPCPHGVSRSCGGRKRGGRRRLRWQQPLPQAHRLGPSWCPAHRGGDKMPGVQTMGSNSRFLVWGARFLQGRASGLGKVDRSPGPQSWYMTA